MRYQLMMTTHNLRRNSVNLQIFKIKLYENYYNLSQLIKLVRLQLFSMYLYHIFFIVT